MPTAEPASDARSRRRDAETAWRTVATHAESIAERIAAGDAPDALEVGALLVESDVRDADHQLVAWTRAAGFTWREIGQHRGVTAQAAQQRYGV